MKEVKIKNSEYKVKDGKGKEVVFGSFIPLAQFGKEKKEVV